MATATTRLTTPEKFWLRVDRSGDCWLWTGRTDAKGYGRVGYQSHSNVGAHRVSWAIAHGSDLPTRCVLHRCDNPPCVNPEHLFLGTKGENNRDRADKGRTRGYAGRTEGDHHAFKVSTELTTEIKHMRLMGATQQAIADATGVSRGHISKIIRGQTVASRKA